ncbi:MAG: hypothetical protein Kow0063_22270 [Anaerolineae bacterium]
MEQQLNDLVNWARGQSEILALYLYGSLAEGRRNSLSDIDVGILVKPEISKQRLWELEDQWLAQWSADIDLRVLNSAPLSFRYEVTARGQRLWAACVDTVAETESLIWRQYWDFRPKLEQDWICYVEHLMEQRNETERQQYEAALAKVRRIHQRVREAAGDYARNLQK